MGLNSAHMVLLQLLTDLGGKKFLLSVDKDCTYRELYKLIADKLELPSQTLSGYAASQLAGRDGAPTRNLAISDKQLDLQRAGGGIYVWVRPSADIPKDEEPHQEAEVQAEVEVEVQVQVEPEPEPVSPPAKNKTQSPQPSNQNAVPSGRDSDGPPVRAQQQQISHFGDTAAATSRRGGAPSPALSIRTEDYDVEVGRWASGKMCPMAEVIKDKRYPVRYKVTRNDPNQQPRVTTLRKPNGAKNWRSECLREGYSWTNVGKYHGMAEHSEKYNRSGRFKNAEAYPRFAGLSEEAQIKQIFTETIRAREKSTTKTGGSPRSKRVVDDCDRMLMSALKSSKQ